MLSGAAGPLVFKFLQLFYLTALAFWVGGNLALGALAAPVVFRELQGRSLPGRIFGLILQRFAKVKWMLSLVLVVTTLLRFWLYDIPDPWNLARYGCLFLLLFAHLYHEWGVVPRLQSLRETIGDFDAAPQDDPARVAFEKWHRRSVQVVQAQTFVGFGLFFLN